MSLILDALNRSRQDSQTVPGLASEHFTETRAAGISWVHWLLLLSSPKEATGITPKIVVERKRPLLWILPGFFVFVSSQQQDREREREEVQNEKLGWDASKMTSLAWHTEKLSQYVEFVLDHGFALSALSRCYQNVV